MKEVTVITTVEVTEVTVLSDVEYDELNINECIGDAQKDLEDFFDVKNVDDYHANVQMFVRDV